MCKFILLCVSLSLVSIFSNSQDRDFPEQPPVAVLQMNHYEKDTAAGAVVLNEFGKTHIDNDQENNLVFEYHVRIKILNEKGFDAATFLVPIRKSKQSGKAEDVRNIKGTTYNLVNGQIQATRLAAKRVYTENKNPYYDQVKFTLPNIRAGSVIDVAYTFSSPYLYNFKSWEFQSDIPKIHSEYWAKIPANLIYNITFRGYYKLNKNESSRISDCLINFNGGKADCSLLKYGMDSIPAFVDEDYMTARSNFLSAIYFELSEVHYFNGSVDKVTKEWADVDEEMKSEAGFGRQLKKYGDIFDGLLDSIKKAKSSDEDKARWIYKLVKDWYKWDGYTGMFTENGLKKAFEKHSGNVADINLSLVAALRSAGIKADPFSLSTRDNGLPSTIIPVISDFNWVVARVTAGKKEYFLDASDPYLPFGVIPFHCLNYIGRCFPLNSESKWISIDPVAQFKQSSLISLKMDSGSTKISGKITLRYDGYKAIAMRKEMASYSSQDEYLEKMAGKFSGFKMLDYKVEGQKKMDEPLIENYSVELDNTLTSTNNRLILHPFIVPVVRQNPFKSAERHYPVDFGAMEDIRTLFIFKFPESYKVESTPKTTKLTLQDKGASFLSGSDMLGNQVIVRSVLIQKKPIYKPEEYFSLKELYNRIVQTEGADVILTKKHP